MDYNEIAAMPLFFIVGRARSGTTLLQTMLDAHPSVIVPGESCVLMHLKNKYFHCRNWSNDTVDRFLRDIHKDKKLHNFWKLDTEKIREQISRIPESQRSFVLLCKIIYLGYPSLFDTKKVSLIGDKNPIYTLFISDLLELFPDARFIHLVRDYRANIASNRESFSLKNIATLAHAWVYHNKKVDAAALHNPERFLILKYEDVVNDPGYQMQKICSFLSIPYDPAVLNYHQTIHQKTDSLPTSRLQRTHGNLLNPVNTTKVDSWKKSLSGADINLSEYIAGDYAQKYGYSLSLEPVRGFNTSVKSIYGSLNNKLMCFIIRSYYHAPLFFKNSIAFISDKLNVLFKVKSYYNQTDFIE